MTRPSPLRRGAVLLALLVALLGLSGCFKASQDVEVRADGSGSVRLHAEINKKALAELFGTLGGGLGGVAPNLISPFRSINRTFPDGTKVRAVDGADRSTLDASFDFSGPDEYQRKLQEVNEAIAPNPDASLPDDGSIAIRRERDQMEVILDPGSFTSGTADFDITALSALLEPDARPEVVVTITMPGSVLTSNGRAQGRTVTWDLLSRGAPATLTASSEVDTAAAPTWALALGIGLIALVFVVTLAFLVSQRRRSAAGADPGSHGPPGPWAPAGSPGTGTFFPPPPAPPAPGGWPVPPPRPPAPAPTPAGVPPWQPTPWSFPPATGAPPAPWSGPPAGGTPPEPAPPAVPQPQEPIHEAEAGDQLPRWVSAAYDAAPAAPTPAGTAAAAEAPPATAPQPGWYADPAGGSGLRYWDGHQWTQHTR